MASSSSSSKSIHGVCFFGGASLGNDLTIIREAKNLGRILSEKRIQVSYGGGILGLMGAVAIPASPVVGIIPTCYSALFGTTPGREIRTLSIQERLSIMYFSADVFIAVPGGIGTLEEISFVVSRATLVPFRKPIGLLNTNGYFDGLISFFDHAVRSGFLKPEIRELIISAPKAEDLYRELEAFVVRVPPTGLIARPMPEGGVDTNLRL